MLKKTWKKKIAAHGLTFSNTRSRTTTFEFVTDKELKDLRNFVLEIADGPLEKYSPQELNDWGVAFSNYFEKNPAAKMMQEAIKREPENAQFLHNYATLCRQRKNYKEAAELYQRALSIDPKLVHTLFCFGEQMLEMDDCKKAKELLEQVLRLDPLHIEARVLYAFALARLDDHENAMKQLKAAGVDLDTIEDDSTRYYWNEFIKRKVLQSEKQQGDDYILSNKENVTPVLSVDQQESSQSSLVVHEIPHTITIDHLVEETMPVVVDEKLVGKIIGKNDNIAVYFTSSSGYGIVESESPEVSLVLDLHKAENSSHSGYFGELLPLRVKKVKQEAEIFKVIAGTRTMTEAVPAFAPASMISFEEAVQLIKCSKHLMVLTGNEDGESFLAKQTPLLQRNVWDDSVTLWQTALEAISASSEPTKADKAIFELEKLGLLKCIVTQTVDGVHQKAGHQQVLEIHGTVNQTVCTTCNVLHGSCAQILAEHMNSKSKETATAPKCPSFGTNPDCVNQCKEKPGTLRPNVAVFGERVKASPLKEAVQHSLKCDVMLVVGAELDIAPACALPLVAKMRNKGVQIIEVRSRPSSLTEKGISRLLQGEPETLLPKLLQVIKQPTE